MLIMHRYKLDFRLGNGIIYFLIFFIYYIKCCTLIIPTLHTKFRMKISMRYTQSKFRTHPENPEYPD